MTEPPHPSGATGSRGVVRQQVLQLWLVSAALDTDVAAWAFYDGTNGTGPAAPKVGADGRPPYRSGVDALLDGWLLISVPPPVDADTPPGELMFCFTFERRVEPAGSGREPS